jgi:hypothetical protein
MVLEKRVVPCFMLGKASVTILCINNASNNVLFISQLSAGRTHYRGIQKE